MKYCISFDIIIDYRIKKKCLPHDQDITRNVFKLYTKFGTFSKNWGFTFKAYNSAWVQLCRYV